MAADPKLITKKLQKLKGERSNFDTYFQDVADLVYPQRQFTRKDTPGTRRNRRIYDSTAGKAAVKLSAAIHGLMINPATKWFGLRAIDPQINADPSARLWLDFAVDRVLSLFATTDMAFNLHSHEAILDLVLFGTAVCSIEPRGNRLIFAARPLAETYLEGDSEFNVTGVYRKFEMDARRAWELWNTKLHEKVLDRIARGDWDFKVCMCHAVYKRTDREYGRQDGANKPYASCYVDTENGHLVEEKGFDVMPYLTPRWSLGSGEVYGTSPTMTLLPDIGMVNAMRRTNIVAAEKMVNPPLMVDANTVEGPIRTSAGSIIYRRSGARNTIEPLNQGARVDLGESILEKERAGIGQGYFLDMLTLPELDRMTATEVMERINQKMWIVSPILARIQQEFLSPLINQTFTFLLEGDYLPRMPAVLSRRRVEIDYVSMMALSQKASESAAFNRWMATIAPLAQVDPTVLDWIESDNIAPYAGQNWFNVPQLLIRDAEKVAAIRGQRAQLQQQMAQVQLAQGAAAAAVDGTKALVQAREAGVAA